MKLCVLLKYNDVNSAVKSLAHMDTNTKFFGAKGQNIFSVILKEIELPDDVKPVEVCLIKKDEILG